MTPACKAGRPPAALEATALRHVLHIVQLLFALHRSCPLFGKYIKTGDHGTVFPLHVNGSTWWGVVEMGASFPWFSISLPLFLHWMMLSVLTAQLLLASRASSTISRSSSASQEDCYTQMRARHQNRKSIVCKQSLLPHMLLKISPTTFCINTNQISPINLLHLISRSTSPALASHRQLKLPY